MPAKFYEEVCSWYRIREGTKNEFVSCDPGGNIIRWAQTNGHDQLWLLIPVPGKERVKIMTRTKRNEYMAVGSNGNILRWADKDEAAQEFWPANQKSDGWGNIYEYTRNEVVDVKSGGNVVRWSANGGNNQRFKFEAWQPPAKPNLQTPECRPGEIGDVPRMTGFTPNPPETTKSYLVAETLLPATVVTDPQFPDRWEQMNATPYYILRREQFWDRRSPCGFMREHSGHTEEEYNIELRYAVTNTTGSSSTETLGLEFGVEAGYAKKKSPLSASLSGKVNHELSITEYQESTLMQEAKVTFRRTLPQGTRFKIVGWCLVDRFTLLRQDRSVVASWNTPEYGSLIVDGYPAAAFYALDNDS